MRILKKGRCGVGYSAGPRTDGAVPYTTAPKKEETCKSDPTRVVGLGEGLGPYKEGSLCITRQTEKVKSLFPEEKLNH